MSSWPYRERILSGTYPPSPKCYYEHNGNGALTFGTVTLAVGTDRSDWQNLPLSAHPERARPIVILTPTGSVTNINCWVETEYAANGWRWRANSSVTSETNHGAPLIQINYQIFSMWA